MPAPTGQPSAFEVAAAELNVPVRELKLWLLDEHDPSPVTWSHWKHNRQPISEKILLNFLKQRAHRPRSHLSLVGQASEQLSTMPHLGDELRAGIEEHLENQVGLLVSMGQKIDELARVVERLSVQADQLGTATATPKEIGQVTQAIAKSRRVKPKP